MDRSQDNEIMQQQQGDHPPFGFSILRLRAFTVFKNQESSENTGAAVLPSATTPALRTLFCTSRWGASVVVLLGLFLGLVVYSVRTDSSLFQNAIISAILPKLSSPLPMPYPPIPCPNATTPAPTCSRSPHTPPPSMSLNADLSPVCPGYFRYIHDDLKPWSERGITRQLVETANRTANFRLTVVGGRLYLTRYTPFEKRDVFTWWGVLQLLRRYPGRLPDVDLMFDADDRPVVVAAAYPGDKRSQAPPLFRYCKDDETLDIPFPDWSFWGWPEINIKPWGPLSEELEAANRRLEWSKREPYAFWRGNPSMSATRQEVMNCNVSQEKDWNARLYAHDWISESNEV